MELTKQIKFNQMTLFTTALCNLNCSYCYICKDVAGGLQLIDKDIEKDFEEGNQIKQILEFDPSIRDSLEGITLWGGEPFLHAERFIDKMEDYFEAFPNLYKIETSTNFSIPNQAQIIKQILDKVDILYHGDKKFIVSIQISIDGYPEMNDAGRGIGVTEKFLKNFRDLCQVEYNSDKIDMELFTKPTLSKDTFKYLETEEDCFKWFNFFDKNLSKVHDESGCKWRYANSLFNCAQPSEWTKEDGERYAKISRNLQAIRNRVYSECPGWRGLATYVPEANVCNNILSGCRSNINNYIDCCRSPRCGGGCGSFIYNIVPITGNRFTMCHRGLFDAYTEYFNNISNRESMNGLSASYFKAQNVNDWIYTVEEFRNMNNTMKKLDSGPHQIFYTDLIYYVREYARAGIIDDKYTDIKEIEKTLGYFLGNSICLQDSYIFSGSWVGRATNEIPLLYNGTMTVVVEELERIEKERGTSYDLSRAIG